MKKHFLLSVMFAFLFIIYSCDSPDKVSKTDKTTANAASSENVQNTSVEELKKKLDEWNLGLVKLERNTEKFEGKARSDYEKELIKLRRQRDDFNEKLDQLQKTADSSWKNIKKDLEVSGTKLERDITNAAARFK